jgi:hypothetical protein
MLNGVFIDDSLGVVYIYLHFGIIYQLSQPAFTGSFALMVNFWRPLIPMVIADLIWHLSQLPVLSLKGSILARDPLALEN